MQVVICVATRTRDERVDSLLSAYYYLRTRRARMTMAMLVFCIWPEVMMMYRNSTMARRGAEPSSSCYEFLRQTISIITFYVGISNQIAGSKGSQK
eukprot:scaffold34608_cov67-Skeletonema_dohrnii-CCMP3373.AAC.2